MKTLVVYFSLEGNTDYVAGKIAERTGAELLRLRTEKAYKDKGFTKFLWGGKSAIMAESPALKPYNVELTSYDRIIFGFPVWAGTFAPPLRTFVKENKEALAGKNIVSYACQSGKGAETALKKLEELTGESFRVTAVFIEPKRKTSPETDSEIEDFCREINSV
ncbi:MAG: flavodoxin family protein [Lentihominibacter sp.]|jgi:flavodoxin